MTIAERVNNTKVKDYIGLVKYDPLRILYEFEDGSLATAITKFEECEPFVMAAPSTMSIRAVRYFRAI